MFFTNGALLSALLPRYPEIKAMYDLTDAQFGLLVIALPIGAVLAGALAAPLIRRFGARIITAVGTVALAVLFALVVTSPSPLVFALVAAVCGLIDAIVDSAQNVQGVLVEQWRGRSVINSLHAIWSLGATTGGLVGAWGAANGVDLQLQMTVNGVAWAVVGILAAVLAAVPADAAGTTATGADATADTREALPPRPDAEAGGGPGHKLSTRSETGEHVVHPEQGPGTRTPRRASARPWRFLLPLSLLAVSGTLIEEIGNSWSALFMVTETAAPAAWVGLGYTVMLASQFVGRMLGDPMTDRWGTAAVARFGGVIISVGVLLLMFGPHHLVTLAGFCALGFGCATLVPAAFAAAARIPGLPHGTGIAVVGWIMRLGFLVGSPVVGLVSDATNLRVAMLLPLGAGITATIISHRYLAPALAPSRE